MKVALRPPERSKQDHTELVYLPVVVASPRDHGTASNGKRPSPGQRLFVVERVLGHGWAVSCDRASVPTTDGAVLAAVGEAHVECEPTLLPARLSMEECRRPIEALASRAAFPFTRGVAADAVELESLHTASYLFRLRYQRNRSGRIDFDALDAVTGRRAGGPLRAAIAAALIDADLA